MSRMLLLVPVLLSLPMTAMAAGDPVKGQRQFAPCTSCHTIDAGGTTKIGPNLHGVFGKHSATNHPDFAYSDALKGSGLVWNEKTLDSWITNPRAKVPGTKMTFVGISKEDVRANIIAYLKTQAGDAPAGAKAAKPASAPAGKAAGGGEEGGE